MTPSMIPNPQQPLHFEKSSGTYWDPDIVNNYVSLSSAVSEEADTLRPIGYTAKDGAKVFEATLEALRGYNYNDSLSEKAVERANAALAIHPVCPEAYNVLAIRASTNYEEALEYFKKAEEQGTLVVNEKDLKKHLKSKNLFHVPCMRAYHRALFGCGNTLRKMGKYKEALVYYEKLAELDQNSCSGGNYINFNAHVPELWLRVHGPEECLKRAVKYKNKDCIKEESCRLHWLANITLALFAAGRVTTYDFPEANSRPAGPGGTKEAVTKQLAPLSLLLENEFVSEYIIGAREMPSWMLGKMPLWIYGSESCQQAAVYATSCLDLWESTPGAVDFLHKMFNTQILGEPLMKAAGLIDPIIEAAPFLELIDDGVFLDATYCNKTRHHPLLHLALFQGSSAVVIVEKMIALGANVQVLDYQGLNAVHKACFYACGRGVIRSLVTAGVDPNPGRDVHISMNPLMVAAEQGNWEELDEILKLLPDGGSEELCYWIIRNMMSSYCIECVGGGPTCQRCQSGFKSHGPNISYTKIVDIVAERAYAYFNIEALRAVIGERTKPYDDLIRYITDKFQYLVENLCAFEGCDNGTKVEGVTLKVCNGKLVWLILGETIFLS